MNIDADIVLKAYQLGLFPMADGKNSETIHWIDPEWRGILPFNAFHIPRSLRKTIRRSPYSVRCNTDFRSVLCACAETTARREDTWINSAIADIFTDLHFQGHTHSVETWLGDDLVGGLYGLAIGGVFFGESMFSRADDASKVALVDLMMRLHKSGFVLLDTQFLNEHLRRFGAVEVPRGTYKMMLENALAVPAQFYCGDFSIGDVESFLQSNTHTS